MIKKVARWPHGCRRKYSEVAVPMLVSSNLTEGGGFFPREKPPPGHGCVCVCPLGADGRVVEGRINTLSTTTARSARVRVPSGKGAHGCINVVYERWNGRGWPGKVPRSPVAPSEGRRIGKKGIN
jgi:hypothetical protein